MDRLNLFNPFEHKSVEHEDRLTWAFLVALRYDPLLQRYLREQVMSKLPVERVEGLWQWEPAMVETQVSRIPSGASFVVSVVIADELLEEAVPVDWVDREARYDGVIHYPDGLVLIIENKPKKGDVWSTQLSPSITSWGEEIESVELYDKAVSLAWPVILEGLLGYAESPSATEAGRQMVGDFIDFVVAKKPNLSPYRTFRLCDGAEALKKRIQSLVEELAAATGLEAVNRAGHSYLVRPRKIAQEAHLAVNERGDGTLGITQSLWPADTVGQARRFYEEVDVERFFALEGCGWRVKPHLHFAFMGTQLVWPNTRLSLREYFEYFHSEREKYGMRSIDADRKLPEMDGWVHGGLMAPEDVKEVLKKFLETRRNHINVIPGFGVLRTWSLDELIALEEGGDLVGRLVKAYDEVLATWGEGMRVEAGGPVR